MNTGVNSANTSGPINGTSIMADPMNSSSVCSMSHTSGRRRKIWNAATIHLQPRPPAA
jgi:hypothetical protein